MAIVICSSSIAIGGCCSRVVCRAELERTALGSWIGRGVQPRVERAPSGGLDVPPTPRASRFSRVSFATTKPCAARSATHFVSPCARPTATSGRRRIVPGRLGRVADGAGCGSRRPGSFAVPRVYQEHLSRNADARPHRGRQRQRPVCDGRDGFTLEQQRAQPRIPQPDRRRLRGDSTGLSLSAPPRTDQRGNFAPTRLNWCP